jgi:hypothetical protein
MHAVSLEQLDVVVVDQCPIRLDSVAIVLIKAEFPDALEIIFRHH